MFEQYRSSSEPSGAISKVPDVQRRVRTDRREFLAMVAGLLAAGPAEAATDRQWPWMVCGRENDLFQALQPVARRFAHASEAIAAAPAGGKLLILADHYPEECAGFNEALWVQAREKGLRLYVEYPAWLPDAGVSQPVAATLERAVVVSERFAPALMPMRLLTINNCRYVPVKAVHPEIVLARVAGCETAVYGLPADDVHPVLFEHSAALMVATTQLSDFSTSRFGPFAAWESVWKGIFAWLYRGERVEPLRVRGTVHPAFAPESVLPAETEKRAFARGVSWYGRAKMLIHPDWSRHVQEAAARPNFLAPAPERDWPSGDGSLGLLEGFGSSIARDGSQPVRWMLRPDCMCESSFAFALSAAVEGTARNRTIAANLNRFVYQNADLCGLSRADPASSSFGLINWDTTAKGVYYADDNARILLGTIGTAGLLGTDQWDRQILSCVLANYRTTGPLGFRGKRLTEQQLKKNGWSYYRDLKRTHYAPHFEAYPWAIYLWAYSRTKYRPFFELAYRGIQQTMSVYPNEWQWTNGIQQERARMLLPLAWLVRIEDTKPHREWLERIVQELLRCQDRCGAIREELGAPGKGAYGPPASNVQYGTAEAPLIQENGDSIADLLYTNNFAFLGLHEAVAATHNPVYQEAEDKLAAFLSRIQVSSATHPELDGGWFRAFDYKLWDYWASNSDSGWGAWTIETGWTQAWITSVLGMRQLKLSLWEVAAHRRIEGWMDKLKPVFLPEASS